LKIFFKIFCFVSLIMCNKKYMKWLNFIDEKKIIAENGCELLIKKDAAQLFSNEPEYVLGL
jgi:hypothetical protein